MPLPGQLPLFAEPAAPPMKSRILAVLKQHGRATYFELADVLGLALGERVDDFAYALAELVSPDGKVVRDFGREAGEQATYRLAEGGGG